MARVGDRRNEVLDATLRRLERFEDRERETAHERMVQLRSESGDVEMPGPRIGRIGIGSVVWSRVAGTDLDPIFVGGLVVAYDEDTVTVIETRTKSGKHTVESQVLRREAIDPDRTVPPNRVKAHRTARLIAAAIADGPKKINAWDIQLIKWLDLLAAA